MVLHSPLTSVISSPGLAGSQRSLASLPGNNTHHLAQQARLLPAPWAPLRHRGVSLLATGLPLQESLKPEMRQLPGLPVGSPFSRRGISHLFLFDLDPFQHGEAWVFPFPWACSCRSLLLLRVSPLPPGCPFVGCCLGPCRAVSVSSLWPHARAFVWLQALLVLAVSVS